MASDSPHHRRRSSRLRGYDYTQNGGYFITICAFERDHLFGEVVDYAMRLNDYGRIAEEEWLRTAVLRPYVELDCFVVMPNHFHGILVILEHAGNPSVGAQRAAPLQTAESPTTPQSFHPGPSPGSLGAIIRSFKAAATKRINEARHTPGFPVWQRNYHEHIIRNPIELQKLREYIEANPARWAEDRYYAQTP